ncbi:MAG: hypothetical protein K2N01_04635 [Lachnospiraceae bacterium]|nr:hypothetical protein [Lachnospiraceae bacterium]
MTRHGAAGGTYEPRRKCDYLLNHSSGEGSRGTGVEDPCLKKSITGEQRQGSYKSQDL